MAKDNNGRRQGVFEFPVEFVPMDGGEPVEVWTTPSDWALADEWVDGLRAASLKTTVADDGQVVLVSTHTDAWLNSKMTSAAHFLAAQSAGLMRPGPIDLGALVEMQNLYEVRDVATAEDADQPPEGGNPTAGGEGA